MARVSKEITFTGTVGDITFYRWEDRIFARKKSSLTRDRVLEDKAFAGLRKHAGDMGRASKLASEIYKQLPADIKGRWIFRAIAGDAASLLYKGKSEQQVKNALHSKYVLIPVGNDKRKTNATLRKKDGSGGLITTVSTKTANKHWKNIFLRRWEQQGKDISMFEIAWEHREPFHPYTIPRRAEYFLGLEQASGLEYLLKKQKK
jgi:hypothetical protein